MKGSEILIKKIIERVDADPHFIRGLNSDIIAFAKAYYNEQLILHDVSSSDLIEINNAHIEDADDVDNYYVNGRVDKLWVTKKSFDNIKCINN